MLVLSPVSLHFCCETNFGRLAAAALPDGFLLLDEKSLYPGTLLRLFPPPRLPVFSSGELAHGQVQKVDGQQKESDRTKLPLV